MPPGTANNFFDHLAFGFVTPDGLGADLLLHKNQLRLSGIDAVSPGDRIEFEAKTNAKSGKLYAVDIKLL